MNNEIVCKDHNGHVLKVNEGIMYSANGDYESEGWVTKLLPNNQVEMDGEHGIQVVNANDTYYLP